MNQPLLVIPLGKAWSEEAREAATEARKNVLYHGTRGDADSVMKEGFKESDKPTANLWGKGLYLIDNPKVAATHGKVLTVDASKAGKLKEFATPQNFLDFAMGKEIEERMAKTGKDRVDVMQDHLREHGYGGHTVQVAPGHKLTVIIDPHKAKATGVSEE
jgi:hypothetical protein